MGNFCSIPTPFRLSHEEESEGSKERLSVNLMRQLSYDIYKIEGVSDSMDDFQENGMARRPSKRYYGVSKSMINRIHSQEVPSTALRSFRSISSARMASFSDWSQNQNLPSSTERASKSEAGHAHELHTETSSQSSRLSTSSSSDSFESDQSDRSPSVDLALDEALEDLARAEEPH